MKSDINAAPGYGLIWRDMTIVAMDMFMHYAKNNNR